MIPLSVRMMFLLFLLTATAVASADSLEAVVDRQTVAVNETLNFRLVYQGSNSRDEPDFSALAQQFDILSNQKSMQHSIVNGAVSASTEWRLILAPKNSGQVLIPPFSINGEQSNPLTVTVTSASTDPVSGKEDVFVETFVDKSNVYVQEQFIVTYRLYYNRSVDSLDAQQPSIADARIETLPRVDYQKTLGHTTYGVAEYRYAMFADSSGTIEIPAQTWTVRTTDQPSMSRFGFNGGRYKLHRVKTKALSIDVAAKADSYPSGAEWLPAEQVKLEESWSKAPANFNVGEPITRTLTLTAKGAAAEQLAPIVDSKGTADFKFYPDKPSQDTRLTERGVVGTRTESIAIVPSRAGELELPAVEVVWWDTQNQKTQHATLPARTINVTGPAAAADPPEPPAEKVTEQPAALTDAAQPNNLPWGWIALCALLLVTNAVVLLWVLRRKSPRLADGGALRVDSEPRLFKAVQKACANQSPGQVRSTLLAWAKNRWGPHANSLHKLGELSGDAVLVQQLKALDATLFAGAADSVHYELLAQHLTQLRQTQNTGADNSQLQPLYGK